MPTGYTADIYNGKPVTLREYASQCARAMSFMYTMRDEPADAPIPESFQPDTAYYDKNISEIEADLKHLASLTETQVRDEMNAERERAFAAHKESRTHRTNLKTWYEAMHKLVEAWLVPIELKGLKEFMLEQLETSINFDCRGADSVFDMPVLSPADWLDSKRDHLLSRLAFYTEERAKEIARTEERNKHLRLFHMALEGEDL